MACQDCVKKNCEDCPGPRDFSGFHYNDKIRKKRRQLIYEKRVGKYTRAEQMVGCHKCETPFCDANTCELCNQILC